MTPQEEAGKMVARWRKCGAFAFSSKVLTLRDFLE
jgi:hypothetical protein